LEVERKSLEINREDAGEEIKDWSTRRRQENGYGVASEFHELTRI